LAIIPIIIFCGNLSDFHSSNLHLIREVVHVTKRRVLGIVFAALSVGAIIASMLLLRYDDASLVWIAMFPLSGAFGYAAARLLRVNSCFGFAVPSAVLFAALPFVFDLTSWWFGGGGILVWFAVFFCLMIVGGWTLVCIPAVIADKKSFQKRRDRVYDTVRLGILFVIVAAILLSIFNLCFGNPITAYIAGEEMKDYLSDLSDETGKSYEIMGRFLPKYSWYGGKYTFDLTDGSGRYVIHWKDGKIRIDSGGW